MQFTPFALFTLFAAVICASLATTDVTSQRAVTCAKRVPLSEYFEYGYDLSEIDLYACPEITGRNAKFADFNVCDEAIKTKLADDGEQYDVPDQFHRVDRESLSVITSGHTYSNMKDVIDDLLRPTVYRSYLGKIEGVGKSMFLNAPLNRETMKTFVNGSRFTAMYFKAVTHRISVRNREFKKLYYTPQFVNDMNALPDKFTGNGKDYVDFVEKYGTHVFLNANFGGIISRWTELKKGLDRVAIIEKEMAMNKDAYVISGTEKVLCQKNDGHREVLLLHDEKNGYFQESLGGHADVNLYKNTSLPVKSIKSLPALLSVEAQPISELFDEDSEKQKSVAEAIKVYMDKAYIKAKVYLIKLLLDNGKKATEHTNELLKKAEESANVYDDKELKKLGNDLKREAFDIKNES